MPDFETTALNTDEGSINGIRLQLETIEDTFENAIAPYDYPYADGADLENMGMRQHLIRVRCYFWDDAEQQTYETHTDLINLKSDKHLDFVHPKYGLIKGEIEALVIFHDDSIRKASVDITFIEQMHQLLIVSSTQSVLPAVEDAYQEGQTQQESTLVDDLKNSIPTADAGVLAKILDADLGLLAQAQEFSAQTKFLIGSVEKYLAISDALTAEMESPVNSIQAAITYTENLPGRILGSFSCSLEKMARMFDSLWSSPAQFISKLNNAFDELEESYNDLAQSAAGQAAEDVMRKHLKIACAQRLALEAAALYADDDQAFQEGDSDFQVMNINELEATLAIVRSRINDAVNDAREIESLKTMATALLTQVNSVRLEREKMISVALDNPMPLHLVCLKYGLPYTDAERLVKVNKNIQNPNFVSGEIQVYA
ncbi:hypothetical protein ASZ90_005608 [hydrocarbon metagenome]|uniref:DNA circulation N-terminal domain-containing protein n=1 Tax=hydrocarbon metagenome TaxID=938273 RepID=A0A0W8FUZ8_9ZZZZ